MKRKLESTIERLEYYEIGQLRDEYEKKGFVFSENRTIFNNSTPTLELDAYAYNPQTGEEIIFEVKAFAKETNEYKAKLWEQIKNYKKVFPRARIVLVSPKKITVPKINLEFLGDIIKKEIKESKISLLRRKVGPDEFDVYDVVKISYDEVNVDKEFVSEFIGSAHLILKVGSEKNIIEYEIPFNFKVGSQFFPLEFSLRFYVVSIKFDFFEFE